MRSVSSFLIVVLSTAWILACCVVSDAHAFANGNAKITAHLASHTTKGQVCESALPPCNAGESNLVVTGGLGVGYDLYLYVADGDPGVGVGGASFGITYASTGPEDGIVVQSWTLCADMEFTGGAQGITWPEPGSGNVVTWKVDTNCQNASASGDSTGGVTALLGVMYVYAYSEDLFEVTPREYVDPTDFSVSDCAGNLSHPPYPQNMCQVAFGTGIQGYDPCTGTPPDTTGSGYWGAFGYVPNRVLLAVRSGTVRSEAFPAQAPLSEYTLVSSALRSALESSNVMTLRQINSSHGLDWFAADLSDTNVAACMRAIQATRSAVAHVESDAIYHTALDPNDPMFEQQWWLDHDSTSVPGAYVDIGAKGAWDIASASGSLAREVSVGVIDTGIDPDHPDLPKVTLGPNFVTGGESVDDDAVFSHGTAMAGLIGALGDNGEFGAGVDWGARLVAIKAMDANGATTTSRLVSALNYAQANELQIVSLPAVGDYRDAVADALRDAKAAGMLVVCPVGNDHEESAAYPAAHNQLVLAVSAVDKRRAPWDDEALNDIYDCSYAPSEGSNYGSWVELSAPGGRQVATLKSTDTGGFSEVSGPCDGGFGGTCAASGIVTGVAALVKACQPHLTGEDIEQVLLATSVDWAQGEPNPGYYGWDKYTGEGIVNADSTLAYVSGTGLQSGIAVPTVYDYWSENVLFIGVPGLGTEFYQTVVYELRSSVTFPEAFESGIGVLPWARSVGGVGWRYESASVYSHQGEADAFSEFLYSLPYQQSGPVTGAVYRTYVYKVYVPGHGWTWYPASPEEARISWACLGGLASVGVGDGRGPAQLTSWALSSSGRGITGVGFRLPATTDVTVCVYDILGRLVRRVFEGRLTPGEHEMDWRGDGQDGRLCSNGIYYYKIVADREESHGRLVLLR